MSQFVKNGTQKHSSRLIKTAKELETSASYYGTDETNYDLDNYDNDGFEGLFKDEEFIAEVDDDE